MNKADFISLINTKLPDGANIPSTDHRDTMHTDANSIGEVVYGDTVSEDTSGVLAITTSGNFDYRLEFQKVGRFISLSGRFVATGVVANGDVIATITDTDWVAQSSTFNGTAYGQGGETIRFYINGNQIKIGVDLVNAESFFINTLIYNAVN
jgi:hypothetical protein